MAKKKTDVSGELKLKALLPSAENSFNRFGPFEGQNFPFVLTRTEALFVGRPVFDVISVPATLRFQFLLLRLFK